MKIVVEHFFSRKFQWNNNECLSVCDALHVDSMFINYDLRSSRVGEVLIVFTISKVFIFTKKIYHLKIQIIYIKNSTSNYYFLSHDIKSCSNKLYICCPN